MAKSIHTTIRKARVQVGESQTEFAKRFDIDQTTLSMWETGRSKPKGPALKFVQIVLAQLEAAE